MIKLQGCDPNLNMSMPNLQGGAGSMEPGFAYGQSNNTTRAGNHSMMGMAAARGLNSKSVLATGYRGANVSSTLLSSKQQINNSLNLSGNLHQSSMTVGLHKSGSVASLSSSNDKFQRSQVNIDRRMREDFDRL